MSDDTPDTNFKVIDTRSPETRARVAGEHVPPGCRGNPSPSCQESCEECPDYKEEMVISDAMKSNPEPMTSIVRWTRFNGTEESLPPIGKRVLLKDADSFAYIPMRGNMRRGDKWFFEDDTQREIEIGDEWTYWPLLPPEGAE